jgi:hypothetical protein
MVVNVAETSGHEAAGQAGSREASVGEPLLSCRVGLVVGVPGAQRQPLKKPSHKSASARSIRINKVAVADPPPDAASAWRRAAAGDDVIHGADV